MQLRRRGVNRRPLLFRRGVNFNGGEYGCGNANAENVTVAGGFSYTNIGTFGSAYIYPTAGDFTYLKTRMPNNPIIRFNVRMERLSTGVGAALRAAEVTRITTILDAAATAGVGVILAPWNFGAVWVTSGGNSVRQAVGSAGFTIAQFADFWLRVAQQWGSHAGLAGVDLTNEPVALPIVSPATTAAGTWQNATQAAVTAIRTASSTLWVWVPTYSYNMHQVSELHPAGPWITDSTGRFGYTSHHYDWNEGPGESSTYAQRVSSAVSQGFTAGANPDALYTRELTYLAELNTWLAGKPFWMGEYGFPTNATHTAGDATSFLSLWNRLLTQYDTYRLSATAWNSGSAVDPVSEQYCVYYSTTGWDNPINAGTNVAATVEAHPSL